MITADTFAAVRQQVNAVTVGTRYGLQPDRHGFCQCPFHGGDDTPSLKLYDGYGDERSGWHCFGCNQGGDVVNLTQRLLGLDSPAEALKQLNADFNLGLQLGKLTPAQRRQAKEAARQRERAERLNADYRAFRKQASDLLCMICRRAFLLPDGPKTKRDVEALKWEAWAEYTDDLLWFGSPEEQIDLYLHRREVMSRCEQVLMAPSTPIDLTI